MEILGSLQGLGIIVFIVWVIFILSRSRTSGNRYWQTASNELGLTYEYHLGVTYGRASYMRFEPLKQQFPLLVDELSPFLTVLNDPAHIFAPVRLLAGTYHSKDMLVMELTGGFRWRGSLAPAQSSNFYFVGHAQFGSPQPTLLIVPTNAKFGEKPLQPNSDLQVVQSAGSYRIYSLLQDDPFITKLLNLLNEYGTDENLYVLITGRSLYFYSTYRPDLVRWAGLLHDILGIIQSHSPYDLVAETSNP